MAFQHSRRVLGKRGLAPARSRGQNFLVHRHTAERIVDAARLEPDDVVVEVGVGLGALTQILAERVRRVIGLEVDRGLVRYLLHEADLPPNVEVRHQDVLKADLPALSAACGAPLRIVANLPYSISSPFLFLLLDNRQVVDRAVVMLQKEVAQRLCAGPGTRTYGALSVLFQALARVELLHGTGTWGILHPPTQGWVSQAGCDNPPWPSHGARPHLATGRLGTITSLSQPVLGSNLARPLLSPPNTEARPYKGTTNLLKTVITQEPPLGAQCGGVPSGASFIFCGVSPRGALLWGLSHTTDKNSWWGRGHSSVSRPWP